MTDHIREYAEICDCPEIQALRGEWVVGDNYYDREFKAWEQFTGTVYHGQLLRSKPERYIYLPPVSSISHPERSMVGAIGYDIVKIVPLTFGENGTITSWRVGVWCETAHVAAWPEGPTLEIAMAKALRWWLTEGKKNGEAEA